MTLPCLPADIVSETLEHLHSDLKSMRSCILVNRMWCKVAIQILWRSPSHYKSLANSSKFWSRIAYTVISCLIQSSTGNLIEILEMEKDSSQFSNLRSRTPPLFDYLLFWRFLSLSDISNIKKYICLEDKPTFVDYLLESELYCSFLSCGSRIKYLELPFNVYLTQHPGVEITLSNLQYLRCDANISSDYYYELSICCRTLQKLYIEIWGEDNEGLANLIRSQKALKHFEIHSQIVQIYPMISDALCTQVNSLRYLRIIGNPCFETGVIGMFKHLTTLILENFNHNVEILEQMNFPELKVLEVVNDTVTPFEIYKGIIESAAGNDSKKGGGGGLKRIYWPLMHTTIDLNPRVYSEYVVNYCSNILFVSIYVKESSLAELEVLLVHLDNLEGIEIQVDSKTSPSHLFNLLSTKSPRSLTMLSLMNFDNEWMLTPEELDVFFHDWGNRRNGEGLRIYLQRDLIYSSHYKVIKKYGRKGVIQEFMEYFQSIYEIEEVRKRFEHDVFSDFRHRI
ncbi:2957_t:CDS:1 [Acaulospora morrowiae]|uniref:2957_t:CDS:1 n=1 Tax=Acaulospora morrowiae TaxID=94023 RepID=A0A9N8WJX2_9GLOM|nr:2957_t:CDS:1 [Acaulospora morrowiae]